jgi:LPXTG-site transpeptidase (sortase) family protein
MREKGRHVRRPKGGALSVAGVAGELVLTAGVVVLLYVAYVLWGTGIHTDRAQDELRDQMEAQTDENGEPDDQMPLVELSEIDIGDGYAFLRIPRFGENWEWVVVEGTELSDLTRGPGHYVDTAHPGELGNLSIAGHRSGYGAPFNHMDKMEIGDTIEIETGEGTWTYTIDKAPTVIEATDVWVVDPTPDERRMTLTTCHPRWGSAQRMYVSAVLTEGEEV